MSDHIAARRQMCDSRQTLTAAPLLSTGRRRPAAAPSEELLELYGMLVEADDQADAPELGRLGWILFAMASMAQGVYHDMADLLDELRAASRAAVAGDGNPASLALLRHVLARHGWLPPPDATPLQVISAPSPSAAAPGRSPRSLFAGTELLQRLGSFQADWPGPRYRLRPGFGFAGQFRA